MKRINLASAHRPLADYAADLGDEILVLTKGRRAVAAIVPNRLIGIVLPRFDFVRADDDGPRPRLAR